MGKVGDENVFVCGSSQSENKDVLQPDTSTMADDSDDKECLELIAWLEKWGAVFNESKTRVLRVVPM